MRSLVSAFLLLVFGLQACGLRSPARSHLGSISIGADASADGIAHEWLILVDETNLLLTRDDGVALSTGDEELDEIATGEAIAALDTLVATSDTADGGAVCDRGAQLLSVVAIVGALYFSLRLAHRLGSERVRHALLSRVPGLERAAFTTRWFANGVFDLIPSDRLRDVVRADFQAAAHAANGAGEATLDQVMARVPGWVRAGDNGTAFRLTRRFPLFGSLGSQAETHTFARWELDNWWHGARAHYAIERVVELARSGSVVDGAGAVVAALAAVLRLAVAVGCAPSSALDAGHD